MAEIFGGNLRIIFSKAKPYILMVGLQFGMAGLYIIGMAAFKQGMSRFVFTVYRNAFPAIALAPFALIFERKIRPKMTTPVFLQILALGFLEPILDQIFSSWGMIYTSASFASAIMNAVPSVTFVLAVILRLERIKMKEVRSLAKVIGTLVTFGGALLMAFYKGPAFDLFHSKSATHHEAASASSDDNDNKRRVMGTLFILVGCVSWSGFYILQSITLKKYPAEMSLSTLICAAGALQSAALTLVVERHHPHAWAIGWNSRLFGPLYTGVVSSGIAYYVQGLVMKSRGPVFVTAFNPLCMVVVAIFASPILAEKLHLGSIIGGIIIAVGLYSVVWGKNKDYGELKESSPETKETQKLPVTATEISNCSPKQQAVRNSVK